MKKIYDIIILGGGPAGLTAAIYAGRYNLKTLVIGKNIGGTANLAIELENWPGYFGSGIVLMKAIREQVEKFGVEILENDIDSVEKNDKMFILVSSNKKIYGKSLIVALGTEHRQLGIRGERKFLGKGVSYCATCDGNFFKNKSVAVIGGSDSAAKSALYLSNICEKVHIIYRRNKMRCEAMTLDRILESKNIDIYYYSNPIEIVGKDIVNGLKIKTEKRDKKISISTIPVDGIFIEIGATPAKDVVKKLKLKLENDYIITNKNTETNVPGVFAAGDVTNNSLKQMITASGEGAIAAKMAHEFLMKNK